MNIDRLDRLDRNILHALAQDGRLSMAELANRVGLTKTPVQARVKRLESEGFIRGYAAIIDHERMGEGHIAFVQVTLSDTRSTALDAFNREVLKHPEIEECHMIAASFRSEEHTSELQSRENLVCRLLLEKKKKKEHTKIYNR